MSERSVVLLVGPSRDSLSSRGARLTRLLESGLSRRYELARFESDREGPLGLGARVVRTGARVVHVFSTFDARHRWRDLAFVAAAKLCGARVLLELHGAATRRASSDARRLFRWGLRLADQVVVHSRAALAACQQLSADPRYALLPPGVDAGGFGHREPGPRDGSLRLVHLGRLSADRGLFEALAALRLARAQGLDLRLTLAGEGPDETKLQRYAKEQGLEDDVCFAGVVRGERKRRLLRESDILILPRHRGGIPDVLLEGMAAGLVPIVTRVEGMDEVVTDTIHGNLVPCRDPVAIHRALERFARDHARLERMSVAARERIARAYSLPRVVRDFGGAYAALLARSSSIMPLGISERER